MEIVVTAQDVHKHYHTDAQEVRALDGLNLQIASGRFIAVMGASGSGKSTLLHLIGGLDTLSSGKIEVEGRNLAGMNDHERTLFRRQRLGIVFQQYNLLPDLTAMENVALPMLVDGRSFAQISARADELITLVDLGGRSQHRPQALSGGEQQRVAIARAMMNDPAVLLADEPTGNLDSHHAVHIWQLLRRLSSDRHKTIVMVTHEAQGASYADLIYVLRDGQVLGEIEPRGSGDASLVAARYQELTR